MNNRTKVFQDFKNSLTYTLSGTNNAGARLRLRKSAKAWSEDLQDYRTLRQAVEATASNIAFTATGRFAINQALEMAALEASLAGGPSPRPL